MSESGAKSSQSLASKGEKDVSEKRGRGRPRKKPQVRGVPWKEEGSRGTPLGSSAHSDAQWGAPRVWSCKNAPNPHRSSTPREGRGCPRCKPLRRHLLGAHLLQHLPGGLHSPPSPATLQSSSRARAELGAPPHSSPAEPAFADTLIKSPLAKAAQRDKMLLEPLQCPPPASRSLPGQVGSVPVVFWQKR